MEGLLNLEKGFSVPLLEQTVATFYNPAHPEVRFFVLRYCVSPPLCSSLALSLERERERETLASLPRPRPRSLPHARSLSRANERRLHTLTRSSPTAPRSYVRSTCVLRRC